MVGNYTAEDGCLCERCGDMATHFHEDFGMICNPCAERASANENAFPLPRDPLGKRYDPDGYPEGFFAFGGDGGPDSYDPE